MSESAAFTGRPTSRVDGPAKVTGSAKYAAEHPAQSLAYGVAVSGAIAKGRITAIDTGAALALPGVLHVFTHENTHDLAWLDRSYRDEVAPPGAPFRPLHSDEIQYSAQPVALVVAETFELARYASMLVRVTCERAETETDLEQLRGQGYEPPSKRGGIKPPGKPRGDAAGEFDKAAIKFEAEYLQPVEHHNPMEPHATTAVWEADGKLTVYDKTQGALNSHAYLCSVFGFAQEDVRVLSPYVGGAFGAGLRPRYQLLLAVLAARELKRSVRVSLTRQQMFTFGYRPATLQTVGLGANGDGTLAAVKHEALAVTSRFEDYQEDDVNWSGALYKCEHATLDYKLAQVDLCTPCDMRAPGGATGVFALECAMDELSYRAKIDPVELRLRNYTDRDQNQDKPFSSKELRECYRQGAERFGWFKRKAEPRTMRDGTQLVGWGMATGIWEAFRMKAAAKAVFDADGRLEVSSATADIGTGTYTIMTQIAADALGLPLESVTFKLGDSSLPKAPIEGGSWTAASVGPAVQAACDALREELLKHAKALEGSPLADAEIEEVSFADGHIVRNVDPTHRVNMTEVLRLSRLSSLEADGAAGPNRDSKKYAMYTHSAVFAEVKVDEDFGTVRVTRIVSAVAGGRILNPKTARSQILGGIVWGIGMALQEETLIDHTFGRFMNHSLAEYHVPVHADIHDIDVIFVDEKDEIINPLGAKGLGEIGIVGVAAAIANAVYHATGKRVRDLPITLDKVMS